MSGRALIITPTGTGLFFDDAYDRENHWRFTKPQRTYDTCVVAFKEDFEPEPGTYDMVIRKKGLKYKLIPQIADMIKWEQYDYIGCWDDDYATDIESVNRALDIARSNDFRLFQQSVISPTSFGILKHNSMISYMETDFIESGVPFFRADKFGELLEFLRDYDYRESEWGIDRILCYYLRTSAHVIHDSTVKHMRMESWYDIDNAYKEMDHLITDFFPRYMQERFNITPEFDEDFLSFKKNKIFSIKMKNTNA